MDPMIRMAEERLARLSADEENEIAIRTREEAFIEFNSAINATNRQGVQRSP